jgi:hypothetical protein
MWRRYPALSSIAIWRYPAAQSGTIRHYYPALCGTIRRYPAALSGWTIVSHVPIWNVSQVAESRAPHQSWQIFESLKMSFARRSNLGS